MVTERLQRSYSFLQEAAAETRALVSQLQAYRSVPALEGTVHFLTGAFPSSTGTQPLYLDLKTCRPLLRKPFSVQNPSLLVCIPFLCLTTRV